MQDPEHLRRELLDLLTNFERHLTSSKLRQQVRALIPANYLLRDLGSSLIPNNGSGKGRILAYLKAHVGAIIDGDELMVVAGISEYARRIRELRVQEGWRILSGYTAREIRESQDNEDAALGDLPPEMSPDQYLLLSDTPAHDAARRWRLQNQIRKSKTGVREKILSYLRANVGQPVTSDELRYVSNDKSEWARRTRELRTEEGWPIVTCFNGDPKLPVGVYVLAHENQSPVHDRSIKEITRREVMKRDGWRCRWKGCGWSKDRYDVDQRYLEVHHIVHHAHGGSNEAENLVTLCNLHHDETHKTGILNI